MDPILNEAIDRLNHLEAVEHAATATARAACIAYRATSPDVNAAKRVRVASAALDAAHAATDAQRRRVATIRRDLAGMSRHARQLAQREARA